MKAYIWSSLVFCGTLTGCASLWRPAPSVQLTLKGKTGEVTDTRYYSNSRILAYEDQQLVRDREESVDFTVVNRVTDYQPQEGILKYTLRTVRKDGTVELHDLAFPELKEEIDYIVRNTGEVLKAGRYPPQSLFFVPSLPLPDRAVKVGDTWNLEHTWYSAADGLPLKLEVVAILKGLVHCEGSSTCADLEISGGVNLAGVANMPGSSFNSRVWGRLLFSIERGDVIWSEMRSQEDMRGPHNRMLVSSCMVSELKTRKDFRIQFNCQPKDDAEIKIPSF